MKVGIVCPYDWSYPGGVRSHILGLAAALGRCGIATQIIAPASRPEAGIHPVGRTLGIPANGSIARVCFSRSAKACVDERLAGGDIDVLHLHEPTIPSVSLLALMGGRLPSVATFHASAPRSVGYAIARPLLRRFVARIGQRIAVSEAARALIGAYFPGSYHLVPNGVEVARFASATPDRRLAELRPFVLFVGRPEPRKGFTVLLRAMEVVRGSLDARLVWAGASPEGLPDWVIALGSLDQDDLAAAYAAADVFCAPSLGRESFGIVLAEAMAAGTPVVCSDLPGYREAAGEAAVFVPVGDHLALATALLEILGNPERASGLQELGRRRVESFDWDVLARTVIDCYERALAEGPGGAR